MSNANTNGPLGNILLHPFRPPTTPHDPRHLFYSSEMKDPLVCYRLATPDSNHITTLLSLNTYHCVCGRYDTSVARITIFQDTRQILQL